MDDVGGGAGEWRGGCVSLERGTGETSVGGRLEASVGCNKPNLCW